MTTSPSRCDLDPLTWCTRRADISLKNAASQLEKQINRWAAETVRYPPVPLEEIRDAAFCDILGSAPPDQTDASPMIVQNLLRHIVAEAISEGVVNCLIVTSSHEANVHLTRIHEHIFDRELQKIKTPRSLTNSTTRGSNCCLCMATPDILCRR